MPRTECCLLLQESDHRALATLKESNTSFLGVLESEAQNYSECKACKHVLKRETGISFEALECEEPLSIKEENTSCQQIQTRYSESNPLFVDPSGGNLNRLSKAYLLSSRKLRRVYLLPLFILPSFSQTMLQRPYMPVLPPFIPPSNCSSHLCSSFLLPKSESL